MSESEIDAYIDPGIFSKVDDIEIARVAVILMKPVNTRLDLSIIMAKKDHSTSGTKISTHSRPDTYHRQNQT